MFKLFRHLWLAITLIALTSAVLLISDWDRRTHRRAATTRQYPLIAVMQFSSTPLLDAHVAGIMAQLQQEGLVAANRSNVRLFNPQGDFVTANAIAQELVNGNYELIITSSTVALQVVAKANQHTGKRHVFGAVTDPYGAGVGITGTDPGQHPPYLAGIGTFQPVENVFRLAKEMNPALKRVGVVWNPGEQCSEACMDKANIVKAELGLTLVEAIATNTSEVAEATRSLLNQNIDAIWIGGDTVANASASLIIQLATRENVPVFTNDPTDAAKGALLGLGGDYFSVGRYTGEMAAAILKGRDPRTIAIENVVPEQLRVNTELLASRFAPVWQLSDAIAARLTESRQPVVLQPKSGQTYKIALGYIVPAPIFEITTRGFRDRLQELGFIDGKNLQLREYHAGGDMSMLPQMVQSMRRGNPDLLMAMSTPALASIIAHGGDSPIIFTIVSAPLEAGVGNSFDDHLPNVTGIYQSYPAPELFHVARQLLPTARRIGALYNPNEANSVKEVKELKLILDELGIELELLAVSQTSEVPEGIQALLARNIDVVFALADNTSANGLPAVLRAAANQNIPVIAEDISLMGSGALMSCAPGPYIEGRNAADLAVRVLLGENPAKIPIVPSTENEFTLDLAAAQQLRIDLPQTLLQRVDHFFNVHARFGRPAKIVMLNLVNNATLDRAEQGVEQALQQYGLIAGVDYVMKKYNAQGDMAQVPQIIETALQEHPDLIITVTTPMLIAAAHRVKDIPLVFTVATDPKQLQLFTRGQPPTVTGVHDDPAIDELLQMAMRHNRGLQAVGTVYDPSQENSLLSVIRLRAAGKAHGIKIHEATATTLSDLPLATAAVLQRGAQALIISADNLVSTGFASVHRAAQAVDVPIFVTDMDLLEQGAAGGIGDDYGAWGRQSGEMAARILAGVRPAALPIAPTRNQKIVEP